MKALEEERGVFKSGNMEVVGDMEKGVLVKWGKRSYRHIHSIHIHQAGHL